MESVKDFKIKRKKENRNFILQSTGTWVTRNLTKAAYSLVKLNSK